MRSWLVWFVTATLGCSSVPGYVRGEGMRPAEAGSRAEGLKQWVEAELEQGRAERAFHGLEALRSMHLFGRRVGAERKPAASGAPRAASDADEALFWEDFKQTEDLLAGYERTANYVELPYRRIFSGGRIVATARDARLALGPRDLLLSYFLGARRAYVFAVRTSGIRAVPLPDSPELQRALVDELLGRLASATPGWEPSAARLYAALLGPVSPELASADALLVVPDGHIAEVPFAVLTPSGGALPLLERYRITYAPSFSVYLQLGGRPVTNAPPRMLAVRGSDDAPPGAALRVFDDPKILAGGEATRSRLIREARHHNVLLFEVPAAVGEEAPLASGLLLAPEGNDDGYLSAAEVASMTLPGCHLILLTRTGRRAGDPPGTAHVAGALAGAFLVAGAPSAVVRSWDVEDSTTEALLMAFFPRMLEVGPAEALREAQLALRARSRTAHPHHWGAFVHHGWGK